MRRQAERDVMGAMLVSNAHAAAEVLHQSDGADDSSVMEAIAATRSLNLIVEDTLRALVAQARSEGHTWAEIGGLLRITRQAAFQRFGSETIDPPDADELPLDGAVELTVQLADDLLAGRWEVVEKVLTARMAEILSRELLQSTRTRINARWGSLVRTGVAAVSVRDGLTVVELPLTFEHLDASCRAVYTSTGQVAGLLWRPVETGEDR
ncbi:hypothetical protein CVV68_18095 [Arthrobacter livingstonensis]|uniref:DUF3887 domain-containing protein n=1 Tax=Arthrobacter livingstonensis TaxID=670078 RepID=A0A2V5L4I3_9MICC|nr:hypothetical protein [Arthrobacter livingstonensis]PYI65482.1 hypothetical protein CVV68_18095 [Arthrobacter livingstonensis]